MMPSTFRLKNQPQISSNTASEEKIKDTHEQEVPDQQEYAESTSQMKMPSTFRLKGQPRQKNETTEIKQQPTEFPFEGENDLEREIERNIARGTSRIGETIAGLPGDILNFVIGMAKTPVEGKPPQSIFPTSSSLKKKSEELTLGYTSPKNEEEERTDEVLQDIAGFMIPGGGAYNLTRNIGIPVVANLAKEGVKYLGGDEKKQAYTKMGTMISLDLLNPGGARRYLSSLYDQSERMVPANAVTRARNLQNSVNRLTARLETGGSSPSKTQALTKLNEISETIMNGEIPVRELIEFRKSINEIKTSLKGFDVAMPAGVKRAAVRNLDQVNREVINTLNDYGRFNPEFGQLNRAANEGWAALEQSSKYSNYIEKTTKNIVKGHAVKTLFGVGAGVYAFPKIAGAAALTAAPVYTGLKSYEILHQVIRSPTLRRYYANVLYGAATRNASQVASNAKKLDEALEKEDQ